MARCTFGNHKLGAPRMKEDGQVYMTCTVCSEEVMTRVNLSKPEPPARRTVQAA